ncbi:MAG TPA: YihY/virulence factor BrkB family protein [Vicinamibacteria bacterium]|nr:YihY/virulence factor BrkB family protein [Vicinamibacteria bacterium]
MDPVVRIQRYFEWLIGHPVAELNRAQRFLRFAVDLVRHCSRELRANDAGQMAGALTYRTIFGLVPLLMVSMLAFRLFGDMDAAARQLQDAAYSFFNYQVDPTRPEAKAFKEALDERLFDVMRTVAGLSFEAIGAVGALLLIWAALGLLVSFEDAANRIYRAPRGRSWLTRIGIYWTVLTLGPILLLVVLYAAEFWLGRAEALPVVGPLFAFLGEFGSLAGSFLTLTLLYRLLPNTHVRWRPAIAGAFVAAVLGDASKWAFGLYVSRALPYLKLYGAIGLIPLFLFWLYVNWLIVLFGLEIAFTLQAMKGRVFEREDLRGGLLSADPQWLLPVMAAIARGFAGGQPVGRQALAEELDLRLESVVELVVRLEAEGLVNQVALRGTDDVGLALALPPDRIPLARIAELATRFTLGTKPREGPAWGALAAIHATARTAAGDRTLADLL